MKDAKGKTDIVEAVGAIQQLILKPEWKTLVQDVLENKQLTEKTQESIVAVANAIVTPLSLLVYAAELPQERVDAVKVLWNYALKHISGKCETEDHEDEVSDEGKEMDSGAKRKLDFQKEENEMQNSDMDDAFVGKLPDSDPENESSTEMEVDGPTEPEKPAEPEVHDAQPPAESAKASTSRVERPKSSKILAKQAAKKGFVTGKTFHERTRSTTMVLTYSKC